MPRQASFPSYPKKPHNSRARITVADGYGGRRDIMLGTFGSPESYTEYARVMTEWHGANRRLPPKSAAAGDLTISGRKRCQEPFLFEVHQRFLTPFLSFYPWEGAGSAGWAAHSPRRAGSRGAQVLGE